MDFRLPSGCVQVGCKACNLILLRDYLGCLLHSAARVTGFLHSRSGGQLAKIATEQGDVICKHCDFNAIWHNGLQIVDVGLKKTAVLVLTPAATPASAVAAGLALR